MSRGETTRTRDGSVDVRRSPSRFARPGWGGLITVLVLAGLAIHGASGLDLSPERLLSAPARTWDFLSRGFPPATDRVPNLAAAMLETIEMAIIGTALGVLLSLPIALLAARNTTPHSWVHVAAKSLLTVMRSVPDLVWAMVFVVSVGLGPIAGILTIMVDTIGFAGRFFAERIEELDRGPIDALRSTGATRLSVMACAVIPTAFPSFTGTSLYCLEKSVRGAAVLGLVGAGGIGVELNVAFQLRQFDTAMTIIIMILVVVLLAERLSGVARKRMLDGGASVR
ncbi:phosphonate ABC transporter, permease protein PhnE [Cryobacterium frigoriphilum]|uniref:Phosphonate ABC transporter, permease protein PhnE n=1 Tax=Cryobacterium frigoriphilum TaxID=1259150 RepID=A0A4R8ZYF4_9MICO|nr:phosphonate ABC transporter, permease protein PhnE [Cryobacterium frigoriphilum]TFD48778.1 phosphonate ABC transporter, permease protein PhnE [Cryobacterium frigoriphilum]